MVPTCGTKGKNGTRWKALEQKSLEWVQNQCKRETSKTITLFPQKLQIPPFSLTLWRNVFYTVNRTRRIITQTAKYLYQNKSWYRGKSTVPQLKWWNLNSKWLARNVVECGNLFQVGVSQYLFCCFENGVLWFVSSGSPVLMHSGKTLMTIPPFSPYMRDGT